MRWILPLVLLAVGSQSAAFAQTAQSPEDAAREYFAVTRQGDWRQAAELMHTEALEELRSFFHTLVEVDNTGEVATMLFNVRSADEFAALSSTEVYARLITGMGALVPGMTEMMTSFDGQVLGSVPEGDVVHVVYRMNATAQGARFSQVQVASFRKSGDRWMALLTGDLQGLIDSLSQSMEPEVR